MGTSPQLFLARAFFPRPDRLCLMKRGYVECVLCLLCWLVPARALPEASPDIRRDATVAAVEQVMPSVVNIATETFVEYRDWYDDLLREFYGYRRAPRQERSLSLGSGSSLTKRGMS